MFPYEVCVCDVCNGAPEYFTDLVNVASSSVVPLMHWKRPRVVGREKKACSSKMDPFINNDEGGTIPMVGGS